jgi:short-subunit dehydrogenase
MPQKILSFQDLRVVITGASSGIGAELALALAHRGARLALVARRAEYLKTLAHRIACETKAHPALWLVCDVGDRQDVANAYAEIHAAWNGVDLLINNAGIGHHGLFMDTDVDLAEAIMRTNFFGALYWTKAVLPQMIDQGGGWLLFISSIAGRLGVPDESFYAASKFALTGFAESLSMEVEDQGVHVTKVFPLAVNTPFFSEQARRRLPPTTVETMIDTQQVVHEILRGLQRGERAFTIPRRFRLVFGIKALLPGFFRSQTRKTVMPHLRRRGE